MITLTRRSVLRASAAIAAGTMARPYIANAQAKTAQVWWVQGFVPQEDVAFRKMVADYEKASGNKIDYSIVPFAPLRQKFISAITSGVVPDLVEPAFGPYIPQQAWNDKLTDVTDVIDAQRDRYTKTTLQASNCYNSITKRRSYYGIPYAGAVTPFHIWGDLIQKAGFKVADIPDRWDAYIDFFKPVQKSLQAKGMRHTYATGFVVSTIGLDPTNTFEHFMLAYGGSGAVSSDGALHSKDPAVREAAVRAFDRLATLFKEGYIPPSSVNWNDADDNNAFHSKLCVMDFDGTLSTEMAMFSDKQAYEHDIVTRGMPLGNDGKPLPSFFGVPEAVIPKGAKNVEVAKDFAKFFSQPKVNNEWMKGGLGRFLPVFPESAKTDPWWRDPKDQHRVAYVKQGFDAPTLPYWVSFSPAWAQVWSEHVFHSAMAEIFSGRLTAQQAADKSFKRIEEIFLKFPIQEA